MAVQPNKDTLLPRSSLGSNTILSGTVLPQQSSSSPIIASQSSGFNASQTILPSSPPGPLVAPQPPILPPQPPPAAPPPADTPDGSQVEEVSPFNMKRFLLTRIAPIGAIVSVILLLGFFIDPLGIFRNTNEQDAVSLRSSSLFPDGEKVITLAGDTNILGAMTVTGDLTAPNIIYSITAGDNITISGDGQRPTISASFNEADSLQTVSARGPSTSFRLTLLGGATLGDVLGLASRGEDPTGGSNGSLYYNTTTNQFRCFANGAWRNCDTDTDTVGESAEEFGGIALTGSSGTEQEIADGDTITIAGSNGLSTTASAIDTITIALSLSASGTSSTISSNSGLELSSSGLGMLRGCSDGELLKWNSSTSVWECSVDTSGGGGSMITQENDTTVVATTSVMDFLGADFNITSGPSSEANVAIDYTNSGITRVGQDETITGTWTFSDAVPLILSNLSSAAGTPLCTNGSEEVVTCNAASYSTSLQTAYDNGNSITTTNSRNISFTLGDTTLDSKFRVVSDPGTTGFMEIVREDGAASTDPAQQLLIDNQNSIRTQPIGLKIQSAAPMTSAIDLSDSEIVNAVNVGANTITGSGYLITSTSSGLTVNATGSDLALTTTSAGNITATPSSASGLFNVVTGNLRVGTGATPDMTLNGEDAFIEGTLEVDGTSRFDGDVHLPNIATSTGNNLCINGSNVVIQCSGSGVTSVNALSGALTIANASGVGSTITINDAAADGATKGIAAFNSTNFSAASGVVNTIQNINNAASPTFAGMTLSGLVTNGFVKVSSGVLSSTQYVTLGSDVTGSLPIANGGTAGTTDTEARTNLSAAKSGANSDITSLTGLTTPLSVPQGGTGRGTFTANGVVYGNGTSQLAVTAQGAEGQVLAANGSGVPTWTTFNGSLCATCMVTDPTASQIVTPTGDNTGVAVKQTATGTPTADIFYVSNNAASTKYLQINSTGLVNMNGNTTINATLNVTGTLTLGTGSGILHSSSGGVISSSAVDLGTSEVTGTLTQTKGGTGFATYTTGDILYASATNTLSKRAAGTDGYVLTMASGLPTWATPSTDVVCSTCLVNNPSSTQTVAPTGSSTTGLSVKQTTGVTPNVDIFNVTNSAASIKYLQIDESGNLTVNSTTATIASTVTMSGLTASKAVFTDSLKRLTSTGTLGIDQGGTGAVNASAARTALGAAASGANSDITSITGLTTALDEIYGGTGLASYTTGDMLYASASNTLAKLGIGSSNQVMTVVGGVPTWQSIGGGAGGLCSTCIINDPSASQIIAPTGAGTIGLAVKQTVTGSPTQDIFYVSDSAGTSKYIQVTSAGALTLGSSTVTIANNLTLTSIISGVLKVNGSGVVSAADVALGTDTSGNYVATITGGAGLTGSGSTEGSTPTLAIGAGNGITVNADDITIDVVTTGTTLTTSANSGLETASDGLSLLRGCSSNQILKWNSGSSIWACAADAANAGTLTGSGSVGRVAKFNTSTDLDNSLLFQANNLMGIGTDFLSASVEPTNLLHLASTNTSTNTVLDAFRIDRQLSTGTSAAGLGAGIVFGLENASGSMVDSGGIRYLFTTPTGGSEAADLVFQNIVSGSLAESLRVTSDKRIRLGAKGTTGDPASCTVGDIYFNSSDATFKGCSATNTWEQLDNAGTASVPLSSLTDAAGTNTLANGNNAQTWNWSTLSSETAMTLASSSITSGNILAVSTSAAANFTGSLVNVAMTDGTGASSNTGSVLTLRNLGTANANTTLTIQHNATGTGNYAVRVNDVASDTTPFIIDGTGQVGIGVTTANEMLTVNGNMSLAHAGSAPTATSGFIKMYAIQTAAVGGIDANTVMNLHFDGTNGSTTFTDSSSSIHTVTPTGATITTSTSEFGTGSGSFDGSSYLTSADSTDWDFGSGDFTIDTWMNLIATNGGNQVIYAQDGLGAGIGSFILYINSSRHVIVNASTNGSSYDVFNGVDFCDANTALTTSTWHHFAFVRSGTSWKVFIDGTQCGTTKTASGTLFNSTQSISIGNQYTSATGMLFGKLDEYRVSKGSARWTSNFTPPTSEYVLTVPAAEHLYALLSDGTSKQLDNDATSGSSALSGLTAATATNTIANANYAQVWNWDTLSTQTALKLASTSITSGSLINATSTAALNFTGSLIDIALSDATGASSNTGSLLQLTNTGTANANTSLYIKHYATGTNNLAFRVDDVASDTSPFVIDGSGNIGIGNDTSPVSLLTVGASDAFQINSSGNIIFAGTTPSITMGNTGTLAFSDGTQTLMSLVDQGTYPTLRLAGKSDTGDPASCTVGDIYFNSNNATFKGCTATNTWEQLDNTAGGSVALSSITDATTSNTVSSGDNAQTWNWSLSTASKTGFSFGESSASSGSGANLIRISSLSTSTATPLFINNVGAATSFRIDDSSSDTTPFVVDASGNVGIGTATPTRSLDLAGKTAGFNTTNDGTFVDSSWTTQTNQPATQFNEGALVQANGYLYLLGGDVLGTVYYTKINSDGTLGTWAATTSDPYAGCYAQAAVYNGYLYKFSGTSNCGGGGGTSSYAYTKLNKDGTVGAWTLGSLTFNRTSGTIAVANGYVYLIGGYDDSAIYYGKFNADGSVGPWKTSANVVPGLFYYGISAVTANGYVYLMGGTRCCQTNTSNIFVSQIQASGDLGTFSDTGFDTNGNANAGAVMANGYIYFIGGENSSSVGQTAVQSIKVNNDGTLNTPTTITALPSISAGAWATTYNGYIYTYQDNSKSIYSISLPRVQIAANIDLLGLNAANPGFGGSSGELGSNITAASVYATNNLEVGGNGQFWDGLGVNGPLSQGFASSVTTASNFSNASFNSTLTGVFTTGTTNLYGVLGTVTASGASSGGTLNSYGGYFTSVGPASGAATTNSIGLYASATQGDNSFAAIFDQGNVGIGDTTPTEAKLTVGGDLFVNTISNAGSYTSALCWDNSGGSLIQDCVGSASADYMEMYPSNDDLEAGDVVTASQTQMAVTSHGDSISKLEKTSGAYQTSVLGIVSDKTKAGDFNSIGYNIEEEDFPQPLALSGRVPVKVGSDSESISPGDFITTSSESGKAMKATQPGMMIGKAIAYWESGSDEPTVMIFVNVTYADPQNASYLASSLGVMAPNSSDFTSDDLTASTINSITVSETFKSLGQTMLADTTIAGDLTIDGTMAISGSTINSLACHPGVASTTISEASLRVGSNTTETDSIATLHNDSDCGALFLQTSALAKKVDIFNGLIVLEKDGAIKAKSIAVEEIKVIGGKSAGTGVITSGTQGVSIENPLIKANSIISITPEVLIQSPLAVTAKIVGESFKVEIPSSTSIDIPFTYLIVNQE